MITYFNSENKNQFELYTHLFEKAYADLKRDNKLTDKELAAGHFTHLDEYFAHMKDLIEIDLNYIMLPLDDEAEGVFAINANTRTITIPAQFTKCAAVQNDEMCEIVVFSIDRYFDFMDLDRAHICIQWINANQKEGITHIHLKDLETMPGKIRFGWPLTSNITGTPGSVQFAVRFYTEEIDDATKETKYNYLLNTLTNTITVKPGLQIDEPDVEEENVAGLFASFVKNSMNPSYEKPKPVFFVAPGLDLEGYGAIDPDTDSLTLTAQAVANDMGEISYRWVFIPTDSGVPTYLEWASEEDGVIDTYREGYTINHKKMVEVTPTPEVRVGNEKYYTAEKNEDGDIINHVPYYGPFPPAEGTVLYERFTELTLDPGNYDIVGEYYVEAVNTISVNTITPDGVTPRNSTTPSPSTKCVVPAPNQVEFNTNLTTHKFTDATTKVATLGITVKNDPTMPDYFYTWYSEHENMPKDENDRNEDFAVIADAKAESYVTGEPGWYYVNVVSKLNRKERENDSIICKVTHLPTAPQIAKLSYLKFPQEVLESGKDAKDNYAKQESEWTEVTEDYKWPTGFVMGDIIRLRVETDLDDLNPLKTEDLNYKWYVQEPDMEARPLDGSDVGPNGLLYEDTVSLNSKFIDVRCILNGSKYNYFCVITNTIQNESKSTDTSDFETFVIE